MRKVFFIIVFLGISNYLYPQKNKSWEIGVRESSLRFNNSETKLELGNTGDSVHDFSNYVNLSGDFLVNRIDTNGKFLRFRIGMSTLKSEHHRVYSNNIEALDTDVTSRFRAAFGIGKSVSLKCFEIRGYVEVPIDYMFSSRNELVAEKFDSQDNFLSKQITWGKDPNSISGGMFVGGSIYSKVTKSLSIGLDLYTGMHYVYSKGDFVTTIDTYDSSNNLVSTYVQNNFTKSFGLNSPGINLNIGVRYKFL